MRSISVLIALLALLFVLPACPTTPRDDDDDATDDDDVSDDDDSAVDKELDGLWAASPSDEGSIAGVTLTEDSDENEEPLEGAALSEVGSSNSGTSSATGEFTLDMDSFAPGQINATSAGLMSISVVFSEYSYLIPAQALTFALLDQTDEEEVHEEVFGVAFDDGLGTVFVSFGVEEGEDPAGGSATLTPPGAHGPFVFPEEDEAEAGNTIPSGAAESEVSFVHVPVGAATLQWTAPAGMDCFGPTDLTVQAGVITEIPLICTAEGTLTGGP